MAANSNTPRFAMWAPSAVNSGAELHLSIPLGNVGTVTAPDLRITDITLGEAQRLSPNAFPLVVGDLVIGNNFSVGARFRTNLLTAGLRYLLTIRGTYSTAVATLGFAVNRYVQLPPSTVYPIQLLNAHAEVALGAGSWTYTLFNDEEPASSLSIAAYSLDIATGVVVTNAPAGWEVETDNSTYVLWFAEQMSDHIPPGQELSGFEIQSSAVNSQGTAFVLNSWNSTSNSAGPVRTDVVQSPTA